MNDLGSMRGFAENLNRLLIPHVCSGEEKGESIQQTPSLTLTQRNDVKQRATLEAGIRLIHAGSATMRNEQKHVASDYESEGRRFESCRARPENSATHTDMTISPPQ